MPLRARRLRSSPARNPTGTAANDASTNQLSSSANEAAGWEGEYDVCETGVDKETDGDANRVDQRRVRIRERRQEPVEPDERHQQPDPVLRATHGRKEAARHEQQADPGDEQRARGGIGLVVAREHEPD